MIQIEPVRSENLSEQHNGVVNLIYWRDATGATRIGTQLHRDGKSVFQWTKDSSLYLRLEMALAGGINPFEALLAKPLARHRPEDDEAA